ncbi:MAG: zinc-ribbon domain-containing protein [Betaproteobacteria bacterium]|nr:zinc-ribbon domain-containing protein [Betaproteobacteria bacterium]
MDLYTRCGNCDTTFRVTTRQLQASGGQVRCGHCQQVFDAFATLTAQEPLFVSQEPVASAAEQPEESQSALESSEQPPAAAESPVTRKDGPQPARPDPAASLYEWEFRMPESPRRTVLWTVLALLLSIVFAGQAVYAFRTELMVLLPHSRSYYERFCESLGCTIGLPKLSSYLHIEASDLKAVDPSHPNEIQLLLSVRNRAPIELAYPAFELTLTNSLEQAIARRVFLPADYLPPAAQAAGLKAGTELPIQLFLDIGALRAAGYRLYLFYP